MKELIELALDQGFTCAASLDPNLLAVRAEVRGMCAADKCRAYDCNWTCPPHCGTLEECGARLAGMASGLLVSDACQAAGAPHYHGKNMLAYTACRLFPAK